MGDRVESPAGRSAGRGGRFVERRRGVRLRVPALTVLWHPRLERVGDRVRLEGLLRGEVATISRTAPAFSTPGSARASRPLGHKSLTGFNLRITVGTSLGAVCLVPGGPGLVADGTPVEDRRELGAEELEQGVVLEVAGSVVLLLHNLPGTEQWEAVDCGLVGESEALVEVRREIRRVADLEVPVLLRGETGTGKELMAQAIHRASRRRRQSYLSVNLGAIPPSLAASELFGAAKGAFTGSVRNQVGYFARAHGGTLFLDEVAEAPAEIQVMLLRVLESGEIQPLGIQETQEVDVRLIAATDVDLEAATEEGSFRAPLFHRLAGYEIDVPPLRERRDDFGRLFVHFLFEELERVDETHRLEGEEAARWLPTSVLARLARHEWPGNVRQLRNVVRQLVIGSRGAEAVRIGPQVERLLQEAIGGGPRRDEPEGATGSAAPPPAQRRRYRDPTEVGDDELVAALRANRWAVKPTARQLGVSRTSLYALIERSEVVRKARDLPRSEIVRCRDECAGDVDEMSARLEVSAAGLRQRMKELEIE